MQRTTREVLSDLPYTAQVAGTPGTALSYAISVGLGGCTPVYPLEQLESDFCLFFCVLGAKLPSYFRGDNC